MIEALRALFAWWSTDTFVKTGGALIVLGLAYFAYELLSAAAVDPFIQFWIGIALSAGAYGASWWYQQEPRRAMLWHVAGFLILIATVCWLQFTYTILNPWFVTVICAVALWRLFVRSAEYRSVIVLAAGFFGSALVPPIIFAEFFTPLVTTLSFTVWWGVGLLVAWRFASFKLFNWLSVTFALLITLFIGMTNISIGLLPAVPGALLLGGWLFGNVLSFHGVITQKATTSRWYEAAIAMTLIAAFVWMPQLLFAGILGLYAFLTFVLVVLRYYPAILAYHPYTFVLASAAFFGAAFMMCSPLGILGLSFVWVLYAIVWMFISYKKLLQYSLLVWLIPIALVVGYGLLAPAVVFVFAALLLTVSGLAIVARYVSLGVLYFIVGWTVLVAAVVYAFLPFTIEAAFMMLVTVGLLGALVLILSCQYPLPSPVFLISLGSLSAGLCGVYLLANAELQISESVSHYLAATGFLWVGLIVSFLITLKKHSTLKAAVLWVLIVIGSLPTLLLLSWLFMPFSFLVSSFAITLLYAAVVSWCFARQQLAAGLVRWFLSAIALLTLALACIHLFLLPYTASAMLLGVGGAVLAIGMVMWTRKNVASLKNHFVTQYITWQLTAWVSALMAVMVASVHGASSGQSSLYILGVLALVSYALTYFARVSNDTWLRLVSFSVLVLTLGRVLAVEAWRLPDTLVLVPFLLTGIVLISLTMKRRTRAL